MPVGGKGNPRFRVSADAGGIGGDGAFRLVEDNSEPFDDNFP